MAEQGVIPVILKGEHLSRAEKSSLAYSITRVFNEAIFFAYDRCGIEWKSTKGHYSHPFVRFIFHFLRYHYWR